MPMDMSRGSLVTPSSSARRRIILDAEEHREHRSRSEEEEDAMVVHAGGGGAQHGEAKSVHLLSGRLSELERDATEAIRDADERRTQVATLKALEMQRGEQLARQEGRLKVRRDRQKREEKLQRMREKQAKMQWERAERGKAETRVATLTSNAAERTESTSKRQMMDKAVMHTTRRSPTLTRRSRLVDEIRRSGSGNASARHRSKRERERPVSSSSKSVRSEMKATREPDAEAVHRTLKEKKRVAQPAGRISASLLGVREPSDRSTRNGETSVRERVQLYEDKEKQQQHEESAGSYVTRVVRTSSGAVGEGGGGESADVVAMQENVRQLTAKLDKMKVKRKALELENEALKREMLLTLSPTSATAACTSATQQQKKNSKHLSGDRDRVGEAKRGTDTRAKENRPGRPTSAPSKEKNDAVNAYAIELARERRRRCAAEQELLYEMDRNRGFQDLVLELRDIIARQVQQL